VCFRRAREECSTGFGEGRSVPESELH
jgi:hypothetical protein